MRDNQAEIFSSYLSCGKHEYSYFVRCTSKKGEFIIPPAKISEMYEESVFGRTESMFLEVIE